MKSVFNFSFLLLSVKSKCEIILSDKCAKKCNHDENLFFPRCDDTGSVSNQNDVFHLRAASPPPYLPLYCQQKLIPSIA